MLIQADQQIFSTRAKHLASKYSDRQGSLLDAHSPRQTSVPRPSPPQNLYHACLLLDNMSMFHARSKKNGGWTDEHTHTHTQIESNNPRCACMQARVDVVSSHVVKHTLCLQNNQAQFPKESLDVHNTLSYCSAAVRRPSSLRGESVKVLGSE